MIGDPRVCIVGAGSLSTSRIYPYIGAAGGRLAGVCDLDREKAARNAGRFGGNVYTDMEEMLRKEEPAGVMICVDYEHHASLAKVSLSTGAPTYVEKPPAPSAADALEAARMAKRMNVLCTVAFKKRYNVAYSRAKEWLGKFDPADYYSISIDYASGQFKNEKLRNTFIFDFGIHAIDLVGYLFGDVTRVAAFGRGLDAYAVSLQFANGAVGSMNLTDGRGHETPTEEVEITVKGGNCMTIHNSSCWRIGENGKPVEFREPPTYVSAGDSGNDTGHLAEIADFFEAIKEKRTTRSNMYESYKSMVVYEAIRKSAEEGGGIVEVEYEPL
jgi:predicted dehydrogenase